MSNDKVCFGLRNPLASPYHCSGVNCLAFDEKRGVLFTGSRDATVRQWLVSQNDAPESVKCHQVHPDWVNDIALIPGTSRYFDPDTVVTCSSDSSACVVDANSDDVYGVQQRIRGHKDYIKKVLVRGTDIITASLDGTVGIYGFEDAQETFRSRTGLRSKKLHSIYALASDEYGNIIATGAADQKIRVYDVRLPDKRCTEKLKEHEDTIKTMIMLPDSNTIVSGAADKVVKIWDLRKPAFSVRTLEMHSDSVWALYPISSQVCLSGGRDGAVFRFNFATGEAQKLIFDADPISSIVSIGSERIVTASAVGTVKIWDTTSSTEESTLLRWRSPEAADTLLDISTEKLLPDSVAKLTKFQEPTAQSITPTFALKRDRSIVKTHVLSNRWQILTQDSEQNVQLWSILSGEILEDLGKVDFAEAAEKKAEQLAIPSWCYVDCKLGSITVTLDRSSCYEAMICAEEIPVHTPSRQYYNLGTEFIKFLFVDVLENQLETSEAPQETKEIVVDLSDQIWVALISDGVCRYLKRVDQLDSKQAHLPEWILQATAPRELKKAGIRVELEASLGELISRKEPFRLTLGIHSRISRIAQYLANEMKLSPPNVPEASSQDSLNASDAQPSESEWFEVFSISCKGKPLTLRTTVTAVKTLFWKASTDPLIQIELKPEYRRLLPVKAKK